MSEAAVENTTTATTNEKEETPDILKPSKGIVKPRGKRLPVDVRNAIINQNRPDSALQICPFRRHVRYEIENIMGADKEIFVSEKAFDELQNVFESSLRRYLVDASRVCDWAGRKTLNESSVDLVDEISTV